MRDKFPTWQYWRPQGRAIVEMGTVHGREVALPPHFHDEDQVTLVLAGRRRFMLAGQPVELRAGEALCLPGDVPHRSFDDVRELMCVNVYLTRESYDREGVMAALAGIARRGPAAFSWGEMEAAIARHCSPGTRAVPARPIDLGETVARLAERSRMSREGFTRHFKRVHGLPPHAFQLMARLNHARALLRAGVSPAMAALEAGFADQSHMGRNFRRFFGTTPGLYRAGEVTSVLSSRPDQNDE